MPISSFWLGLTAAGLGWYGPSRLETENRDRLVRGALNDDEPLVSSSLDLRGAVRDDAALRAAATLLGDGAGPLLEAATGALGGRLVAHRPFQTSYRPGRKLLVHYDCQVVLASGQPANWTVVAMDAPGDPPRGALVLERDAVRLALWRFPYDPFLPGLPSAVDRDRVRELLDTFGVTPGRPALAVRSYRAGRRAVVEARVDRQRLFLKVVRPAAGEALHRLHTAFAAQLPVPPSLGWSAELGIVALPAAPGRTLKEQLALPDVALPDFVSITDLCDRIVGVVLEGRAVSAIEGTERNARSLIALQPELSDRVARVVEAVRALPAAPSGTVHGDLHPGQLLTADVVTGLLDVDRAGHGVPADDYAMLLGHLDVLATTQEPVLRTRTEAFADRLRHHFGCRTDARELAIREAAVMIGLATAPFRALQQDWRAVTEQRVRMAESLAASGAGG